jgi:hypothetical protein
MTQETLLHEVFFCLADAFEGGGRNPFRTITPASAEEYETLREVLASLIAEGSLVRHYLGIDATSLTPAGYQKYKARIAALRVLG